MIRPYLLLLPEEATYIPSEHLALEYLAEVVRKTHEVQIYDAVIGDEDPNIRYERFIDENDEEFVHYGVSSQTIRDKIMFCKPEVVGVTAPFYSQERAVRDVCRIAKGLNRNIKVVVGGSYPSAYKDEFLKHNPDVDVIVIGEGEVTFKELLDRRLQNMNEIEGIAFRQGSSIVRTPPRPVISDLDDIPFPARDLVPYRSYAVCERLFFRKSGLLNSIVNLPLVNRIHDTALNFIKVRRGNPRIPTAHIITSRGCPMNCIFCVVHNVWGNKLRMRSPENVSKEFRLLIEKYGIRNFDIVDDNFNFSKKRVLEICRRLEPLRVTWRPISGAYIPSLDRETLAWMKRSGCSHIALPIESGNQDVLRNVICKNVDLGHARDVLKICKDLAIRTEAFFVLGLPGETKQDMIDTIRFASNSEIDVPRLFVAVPFPGSRLFDECIRKGYLTEYYDLSRLQVSSTRTNVRTAVIKTDEFSPDDVIRLRTIGYKIIKERNFEKYEEELQAV